MKNNKEKNNWGNYISDRHSDWLDEAIFYEENQDWLDKSAFIALKILRHLRAFNITQKELAENLNVTPQYINKVVKGRENLSLETICKIERVLNIKLIEIPFYEANMDITFDSFTSATFISRIYAQEGFSFELSYDEIVSCPDQQTEELQEAA